MTSEREQTISNLNDARRELLDAIEGLPDEQLSQGACVGDWTPKDVLSHVASWDEMCCRDFRRLAQGDAPGLAGFKPDRVDDYNFALMSFRLHLPAAQARREVEAARSEMLAAVEKLPEAQFGQGQFGRALLDIEAHHDRDHAQSIRDWRKRQGL